MPASFKRYFDKIYEQRKQRKTSIRTNGHVLRGTRISGINGLVQSDKLGDANDSKAGVPVNNSNSVRRSS